MSMFDRLFKGKKRDTREGSTTEKRPSKKKAAESSEPKSPAQKKKSKPSSTKADTQPAADVDPRSPEERCGVIADMDKEAIKTQLAKMFRRYNRLASSLDGDARIEAEAMLDLIVGLREKHLS